MACPDASIPPASCRVDGRSSQDDPAGCRGHTHPRRRLIVNADDFGRSRSINEAVIRAHREGILTTASLMVNEGACDEAVALAKQNPRLGIGLHLALLCGRSALPRTRIPGLVDDRREFTNSAVAAGMKYFFRPGLRAELESEIGAQFERFYATGLPLDHVNGHLHMHLHPVVFSILMQHATAWRIRHVRLTRDSFCLNAKLAGGAWLYRASHALIYRVLSARARPALLRQSIQFTPRVFGLLQNARVDERYVAKLLPALPPGDSELYSHPSLDEFKNEFDALINPAVQQLVREQDIELIRYQDL
jgi:chitin disaccharide deacetylase